MPQKPQTAFLGSFLLFLGFLGYLVLFLRQPSNLPISDETGEPVNRLIELFIMPFSLNGIFGYQEQPLGILDRIPLLAAVLLWLTLGWWLGRCLVCREGSLKCTGQSQTVFRGCLSILAGLALLSTIVLLTGLAGGLVSRWPLIMEIALLSVLGYVFRPAKEPRRVIRPQAAQLSAVSENALAPRNLGGLWLTRLIPLATCVLAATYVLGGLLPPWEFDVVEYHLQAPKEFSQTGRIGFLGHNVYANMPLGAEMHSLAWMVLIGGKSGWWAGALVGKCLIAIHAILAAVLVGGYLSQRLGGEAGWASAGLLLAMGGSIHVSQAGLIDMVLGAYVAAAVIFSEEWRTRWESGESHLAGVLTIGVLAGGAAACKYPGILFAVLPMAVWLGTTVLAGKSARQTAAVLLAFALASFLTWVPWLAKNAIETGNPVYPLASILFEVPGMSERQIERWQTVHSPPASPAGSAFTPRALFDSAGQVLLKSPFVNPSLVFFFLVGIAFAALRGKGARWLWKPLFVSLWILGVWWLLTHRIDRFWLPIVPLLTLSAGYGMAHIARHSSATLVNAIVLFGITYGLLQSLSGAAQNDNRFFVSQRALELEHRGAVDGLYRDVIAWLNENLNSDDQLLCIGEAKAFHFQMPIVYATCFNETPGEMWLDGKDGLGQLDALSGRGITHVLVSWSEIERYRSPGNYGFSAWPTRRDLESMVAAGVLLPLETPFESTSVQVFAVNR